jgi:hypothetical protein
LGRICCDLGGKCLGEQAQQEYVEEGMFHVVER